MQQTKFLKTLIFVTCFLFLFFNSGQAQAATECNDGADNDGVGGIDIADADCVDANDDHESASSEGYFFKAHTTYNEKIPANPVVDTARTAAFQDELAASNRRNQFQSGICESFMMVQ
jgi:hypothetical protein